MRSRNSVDVNGMKKFSQWFVAGAIFATAFGCVSVNSSKNNEEKSSEDSKEAPEEKQMQDEEKSETQTSGCGCSSQTLSQPSFSKVAKFSPVLVDLEFLAEDVGAALETVAENTFAEIEAELSFLNHAVIGEVQEEAALIEALLADEIGSITDKTPI